MMDSQQSKQRRVRQTALSGALVMGLILAGLVLFTVTFGSGRPPTAHAAHNNIACDDDVPAGWSCVPLVNKPQSASGATSPAIGELLYKFVDADTLWVSVRALPGQGPVQDGEQMCLDDDNEPFADPTNGTGNKPRDCTGANAAAVSVADGTSGIPDSSAEPDDDSAAGLNGDYEVRVFDILTDGTADSLTYAEFNNIDGYS